MQTQEIFLPGFLQQLNLAGQLAAQQRRNFTIEFRELFGHSKARIFKISDSIKHLQGNEEFVSSEETTSLAEFLKKRRDENLNASNEMSNLFHFIKPGDEVIIEAPDGIFKKLLTEVVNPWDGEFLQMKGKKAVVIERHLPQGALVVIMDTKQTLPMHVDLLKLVKPFAASQPTALKIRTQSVPAVGDLVRVGVEVDVLRSIFQASNTVDNPAELVRSIGILIMKIGKEAIVSWNYFQQTTLPVSILRQCTEAEIKIHQQAKTISFPNGIKRGSQVFVDNNILEVMRLQSKDGNWAVGLTKYVGKKGDVFEIFSANKALVYFKDPGSCYLFDSETLLPTMEKRKRTLSGVKIYEPEFKVDDMVRFKINEKQTRALLTLLNIPEEFVEFALDGAEVLGYASPTHVVVTFGGNQHFRYDVNKLTVMTSSEADNLKGWKTKTENLLVGNEVMVWFGPPNYTKKCLNMLAQYRELTDEKAILVGYTGPGVAVIRYESGKRYALPLEYLCAPRGDWLDQARYSKAASAPPTPEPYSGGPLAIQQLQTLTLHPDELDVLSSINKAFKDYEDDHRQTAQSESHLMEVRRVQDQLSISLKGSAMGEMKKLVSKYLKENAVIVQTSCDAIGFHLETKTKKNIQVEFENLAIDNTLTDEANGEDGSQGYQPAQSPSAVSTAEEDESELVPLDRTTSHSQGEYDNAENSAPPLPALHQREVQTVVIPENTKQVIIQIGRGDFDGLPVLRGAGGEERGRAQRDGDDEYTTIYNDSTHNIFNKCNVQLRQ